MHHGDTVPSVMEANEMDVTAQQEWEAEWNSAGLASRLSQQVHGWQTGIYCRGKYLCVLILAKL